jgi:glycosyltransferase involved in cell wall biosynthesis
LASVLAQSETRWELIVIDDASPQPLSPSIAAMDDPRLHCLRLDRNLGPGGARDAGLRQARGRFAAFLDSDDVWAPDYLARQLAALEREPGSVTVVGARLPAGDGWRTLPERCSRPDERIAAFLFLANQYAQMSGVAAPLELAQAAGFGSLRQYEDWGFLIRAEALGARIRVSNEPMLTRPDDRAADRSGAYDDPERAAAFLASMGPLLAPDERFAFRLRYIAPSYARSQPLRTLGLATQAMVRAPRLRPAALKLLTRVAIGDASYATLQRVKAARSAARVAPPTPSRS